MPPPPPKGASSVTWCRPVAWSRRLCTPDVHEPARPRAPEDGLAERRLQHPREQGDDVDPHSASSPSGGLAHDAPLRHAHVHHELRHRGQEPLPPVPLDHPERLAPASPSPGRTGPRRRPSRRLHRRPLELPRVELARPRRQGLLPLHREQPALKRAGPPPATPRPPAAPARSSPSKPGTTDAARLPPVPRRAPTGSTPRGPGTAPAAGR